MFWLKREVWDFERHVHYTPKNNYKHEHKLNWKSKKRFNNKKSNQNNLVKTQIEKSLIQFVFASVSDSFFNRKLITLDEPLCKTMIFLKTYKLHGDIYKHPNLHYIHCTSLYSMLNWVLLFYTFGSLAASNILLSLKLLALIKRLCYRKLLQL